MSSVTRTHTAHAVELLTSVRIALDALAGSSDVDAILLGGSRPRQLRENIEAVAAGPLPDDVVAACAEVGATLRGPTPAYHR